MEIVALHTRLKVDTIDEYEKTHAVIPLELDSALRRAGVKSWVIWRSGQDLFHWVEVDEFAAMSASLDREPSDREWQTKIAPLLERESQGALHHVWSLPTTPAALQLRND